MIRVAIVAGARPNFMKIAPMIWCIDAKFQDIFEPILIHTGQHFSPEMSDVFFKDLEIPPPHYYLGVHHHSSNTTIAKIMLALEPLFVEFQPHLVIVVGDVNSTLAAALTANKIGLKVAHVEAGLRSFDRSMPEEINRILTDHLSDFLFTHSEDATENLLREGIDSQKIFMVGNIMADTMLRFLPKAREMKAYQKFGLEPNHFALLTLHRPSNVDHIPRLHSILSAVMMVAQHVPVVFPVHPRTERNLSVILSKLCTQFPQAKMVFTKPLSYLDFLSLMDSSLFIMTDSGGIQEESTLLGKPCLTLRENTERPITVTMGTNKVIGTDPDRIVEEALSLIMNRNKGHTEHSKIPPLWDGKTACRILKILKEHIYA